ncbi:MAG TPA: nucleotide pyrophosphatase/phosphodiesterase family protein [Planctomycetota bacterium]|nr:nucleotide pyrophosphatase/phosphodiesterase family protein [Planctomycetota bacterium]
MKPVAVINVAGLTAALMGDSAPRLKEIASGFRASVGPVLPAVTCPVQATYLTGLAPRGHGVVANGWYFRELSEVLFWRQSARLMSGETVWAAGKARDRGFTCAQLFWWFNMYCGADWAVTPRPAYPADGRKIPDIYADPPDVRTALNAKLGRFPLFNFWGPKAGIESTRWIASAAAEMIRTKRPTLTLVYLPHLDYDLQRLGPGHPDIPARVREVDEEVGRVAEAARSIGAEVIVLSEYGVAPVSGAVHINRELRNQGFLRVQRVLDRWELLDAGASRAFAVADHQVAHVYVKDAADVPGVKAALEKTAGIARVLDEKGKREAGLDHARSGELVALAAPDRWFTYFYWLDDRAAPDFARTVDIHRKPGYDPVELFLDPAIRFPAAKIGWKLLKKMAGFRTLMDVIPLDASLVKGSHGLAPAREEEGAVLLSTSQVGRADRIKAEAVKNLILATMFGG